MRTALSRRPTAVGMGTAPRRRTLGPPLVALPTPYHYMTFAAAEYAAPHYSALGTSPATSATIDENAALTLVTGSLPGSTAPRLNGTSQSLVGSSPIVIGLNDFTLSGHVLLGAGQHTYLRSAFGDDGMGFEVLADNRGVDLYIHRGGWSFDVFLTTSPVDDGVWHDWGIVCDRDGLAVGWWDGAPDGVADMSAGAAVVLESGAFPAFPAFGSIYQPLVGYGAGAQMECSLWIEALANPQMQTLSYLRSSYGLQIKEYLGL